MDARRVGQLPEKEPAISRDPEGSRLDARDPEEGRRAELTPQDGRVQKEPPLPICEPGLAAEPAASLRPASPGKRGVPRLK